jgi:hypothetical protein
MLKVFWCFGKHCSYHLKGATFYAACSRKPKFHFLYRVKKNPPWALSWVEWIHSKSVHPVYLRSVFTVSSHLRLALRRGLVPSGFQTRMLYAHFRTVSRYSHGLMLVQVFSGCGINVMQTRSFISSVMNDVYSSACTLRLRGRQSGLSCTESKGAVL